MTPRSSAAAGAAAWPAVRAPRAGSCVTSS